jgi:hypothetical protein
MIAAGLSIVVAALSVEATGMRVGRQRLGYPGPDNQKP